MSQYGSEDDEYEYEYEKENYTNNNEERGSLSEENGTVISHVIFSMKRKSEEKTVSIFIKYYDETDAFDGETEKYEDPNITSLIDRKYPGWTIYCSVFEGFSSSSYFDLDMTKYD